MTAAEILLTILNILAIVVILWNYFSMGANLARIESMLEEFKAQYLNKKQ